MWAIAFLAALLVAGSVADDSNPCASQGGSPYDYKQALCMGLLFYDAQRSGRLDGSERFDWRGDSATGDGSDVGLDLTGGYYDAGDHVKFGFPMAYSVTVLSWGLLSYHGGYESAGQVAQAEAAIRWGCDYFLKAHSSSMTLWGQVGDGDADHAYWGRPEDMTMNRPAFKIDTSAPGSDLAGETAAALAAASIVFYGSDPSYSSTLLDAAKDLFAFADQYRQMYHISIPAAANFYQSFSGYNDELAWSAMWLYKATGDSAYETKAKAFWDEFGVGQSGYGFGWDNKNSGAMVLYAEEFGGQYTSAVQGFMNDIRGFPHTPGGMVFIDQWGSLRQALNVAFIGFKAADLGIDSSTNRNWAAQQVDYALGSIGHSYIVGFGTNPPLRPHHRSSSCPYPPDSCTDGWAQSQSGPNPHTLYGAVVGGPDQSDNYNDDRNDYVQNEVACDYNAAFTGTLAAMISSGH
jgi:hypothetical protein